MTVPTSVNRVQYDGNGLATEFSYTFKIFKQGDLRVSLLEGETETVLSAGTDYSVDGVGNESGGTVTFSTAPASGKTILIIRLIDITQETDLRNQGAYLPETVEDELDRGRMIDQQHADDIRRSIRVPAGDDAGFDAELPRGIVGQANRAVITNSDGTGFEAGPTADQVANAQQYSLDSLASSELAEQWANEAEDVEVAAGEFSSLHYRAKASQQADRSTVEANRSRDEADRAQGVVDNTESYIGLTKDFHKGDGSQAAWTAPTATTLETASTLALVVGSTIVEIAAGTSVTLPALSNGTDYTVYAHGDGTLEAVDADSAAPAGARTVGGFHSFANGGIASRSLWDLNWRPSAPSPRAMVHDPKCGIWADIYLMDTQYGVNGYSRNGAQIADANSAPVIPDAYGGDGSSTYANLSWWVAVDLATAAGKRLPFYQEFASIAYGVVERQAVGTDPVTTQHQAGHRSACGCEQITGVMWQWGADINGTSATGSATWNDWTDGRGDIYTHSIRSPLFGAAWDDGSNAGSRASRWSSRPDSSVSNLGARGVCDHLNLQAER